MGSKFPCPIHIVLLKNGFDDFSFLGNDYYFSFHHSAADYINAFEEGDLEYTAGIFASLAHVIANMDEWW